MLAALTSMKTDSVKHPMNSAPAPSSSDHKILTNTDIFCGS